MTIALLSHIMEATGVDVHDLFDIICGTRYTSKKTLDT